MALTTRVDRDLLSLARRQHGVFHVSQARSIGMDRGSLHRRRAAGNVTPIGRQLYMLGSNVEDLDREAWLTAAVLDAGPGGALCHETAAARHGDWTRPGSSIHVFAPARGRGSSLPGVEFHRLQMVPGRLQRIEGIPTVPAATAIIGMGVTNSKFQVANAIAGLSYRVPGAEQLLRDELAHRRVGATVARAGLALFHADSVGTRSVSEDRLVDALVASPLGEPVVNTRGIIPGLPLLEPDIAYPEAWLVIEVDGPFHARPDNAARDALRDAAVAERGWATLRFTTTQIWNDLPAVVRAIGDAVRARSHPQITRRHAPANTP